MHCTRLVRLQQVAHVMDALEERMWALQLGPALLDPSQPAVATNSEHAYHGDATLSDEWREQTMSDVPRYPCPAQQMADAITRDADCQYMMLMGLAMAGRAAIDLVDAGRLQAWLAIPGQGEGPDEAAGRAAQLMMLWHQCSTCQHPALGRSCPAHVGSCEVHQRCFCQWHH